jgi:hypothetical protein
MAPSRGRTDRILQDLLEAGISRPEISVLFLDPNERKDRPPADEGQDHPSVCLEPAGVIRGVLATIDGVGALTLPGAGRLIGAGPLMAALSGNSRGGPAAGVAGILVAFGLPSPEAGRYETRIKEGGMFISVRTENPDKCDRARDIFVAEGAQDVFTMVNVTTPKASFRGNYGSSRVAAA